MAAQGKGSKWGSFLSQAVAGVEARLDTILADGEEAGSAGKQPRPSPTAPAAPGPPASKPSPGPSRSASTNRTNDRLQERLARAVAAKNAAAQNAAQNAAQKPGASSSRSSAAASPRQSLDVPSRASLDSADHSKEATSAGPSPRPSQDVEQRPSLESEPGNNAVDQGSGANVSSEKTQQEGAVNGEKLLSLDLPPPELSVEMAPSPESAPETAPVPAPVPDLGAGALDLVHASRIEQLERQLEEAQRQHQEETHEYVEKIDALQSKLQYLSREASDSARKAIQTAPAGSLERKLAEKDEQIAQLMEEGKNLGVTEQKHRSIIKKLRTKITEDEKEISDLKTSRTKAEAELATSRARAKRVAELERSQEELQKRVAQVQKEADSWRSEANTKERTISELKAQLQRATERAEAIKAKVNDEALEKERRRARDLEDQVAALQVEKNLVADRAKAQANELKEKAERASERARVVEVEMKAEVQIMESKLEAMRIRAEEASSGAIGDSQAKLLRQVETLQTQYAIASENWQGIEATLLARVASLEKERDEALQRESDMRKKAREAAVRAKRQEEELEEARARIPTVEEDVRSYQSQLEALKKRAEEAEAALLQTKTELENQRASWKEDKQQLQQQQQQQQDRGRSDSNDRRTWLEDLPRSHSRPESPLIHGPTRTWSSDLLGLQAIPNKLRKASAPSSHDDPVERFSSVAARRPSAQPPPLLGRPSLQQTGASGHRTPPGVFSPTMESSLPTPSSSSQHHNPLDHQQQQDDPLESLETASSSPQNVLQDMVSVSTVAAGPSVQLVERMSAAIRRLESEKVAAREELARISSQRDEARGEMVALMREAEAGKAALRRVADLEAEVADVNARYETTLELLGEKSELVEELKSDVEDVKAMYRDLVERTIK